jgi:hypothetical protein
MRLKIRVIKLKCLMLAMEQICQLKVSTAVVSGEIQSNPNDLLFTFLKPR